MWTATTRVQHSRAGLRYGSDVTDAEWALLSTLLPPPRGCGRRRKWEMREIINAIFYVLRGGIAVCIRRIPRVRLRACGVVSVCVTSAWQDRPRLA
jgi:hypothetical protein